ncbi:fungal-specific transcription factor domain-containing protein [Ustulina deusta]|nr:fungal-specific transcription factor domain-containing protein [Ustulina deusta]
MPGLWPAMLYPEIYGVPEILPNNTPTENHVSKVNDDAKVDSSAHVTSAVQNALDIYFYRKIYDIDALLLQHLVSNVLAFLTLNQCVGSAFAPSGSLCLVWPAFIAACEAQDATVRKAFPEWFESCARNSGFRTFNTTLKAVKDAWSRPEYCSARA